MNKIEKKPIIDINKDLILNESACISKSSTDSLQKSYNYSDRPTFYYQNDISKPIRAGGVIIYRIFNDSIQFLMIKTKYKNYDRYEDIGGKTDKIDISELDTIAREVSEETNQIINQQIIKYQLTKSKSIYIPHSKYLLYFVKANLYEQNLKSVYFGDKEIKDDIFRTIHWIDIKSFINNKLNFNPRITSDDVNKFIKNNEFI